MTEMTREAIKRERWLWLIIMGLGIIQILGVAWAEKRYGALASEYGYVWKAAEGHVSHERDWELFEMSELGRAIFATRKAK